MTKPIKDHAHGVADQNCGHADCVLALRRYQKRWRVDRATTGRRTEATRPVKLHIASLEGAGWSVRAIGEASGVPASTISRIRSGRQGIIRRTSARAVLRLRPEDAPNRIASRGFLPKIGTIRRLQALIALGWSPALIAAHVDEPAQWVYNRLHQSGLYVTQDVRDRVVALYEDLSMALPPQGTVAERRAVSRARTAARKQGWLPPLAWEDDELDNPRGKPARAPAESLGYDEAVVLRFMEGRGRPDHRHLSHDEAAEIVRRLVAQGATTTELERHGFKPERYNETA